MSPLFIQFSLTVVITWLAGLRKVDCPPWGVNIYDATGGSLRPMMRLRWGHHQGLLLPHWWWCIMLVLVWFQKEYSGRERLFFIKLQCMLTQFTHLRGGVGMQNRGLFPYHDAFWRPFDAHGCNHVEWTEESEATETHLESVTQYLVVQGYNWRAREESVVGDTYFSVAFYFLIYREFFWYPKRDNPHVFDVIDWVNCEGKRRSALQFFVYWFLQSCCVKGWLLWLVVPP